MTSSLDSPNNARYSDGGVRGHRIVNTRRRGRSRTEREDVRKKRFIVMGRSATLWEEDSGFTKRIPLKDRPTMLENAPPLQETLTEVGTLHDNISEYRGNTAEEVGLHPG